MIAIIDYGMGNLRSVQKAIEKMGAETVITQDSNVVLKADKIVLPGVGAIKPAYEKLNNLNLVETIKKVIDDKKPFLGICLGFQLLFDKSYEGGEVKGLGILKGSVKKFESLKIPQMGWNQINIKKEDCPIFKGINNLSNVYFCHSYYVDPEDKSIISTTTEYGIDFASSIWKENIYAMQFHPEKSQKIGLNILNNFVKL